jgi:ubiquinone/menaquinone biosynthesis C-methylase UbiE
VGIDINQMMLNAALTACEGRGLKNISLHRCSASALDFPNNYFDLTYSYSTLLLVPDTRKAIAEIFRVTKPGGVIILDITGRYNLSQRHWSRYYQQQGHFGLNSFTRSEIHAYLKIMNGQVIEEYALGFTDQWKYLPFFGRLKFLEKLFHSGRSRDLDYRVSNLGVLSRLANRWFIVCRKLDLPTV